MQMCVVEFARNVLGLKDAVSREVNPQTSTPVIDLMEDQKSTTIKGGTMRLGAYDCRVEKNTLAYRIYGSELISERHRHRYEFRNGSCRHEGFRKESRDRACGDCGDTFPSVLHRCAVPSGAQEHA